MPYAIPIALAASSAASAYGAYKQGQAASSAEDLQKQLMARQASLANILQNFGTNQISAAEPAINAATRYYMTLAQGNRSQINQLLAPQRAQMADTFRGGMSTITNKLAPGPQREAAIADLNKQQVGMQGLMPMQARSQAVGQLADLGANAYGRGINALSGAGSALTGSGNSALNAFSLNQAGSAGWQQFGASMANIWLPYLMNKYGTSGNQKTPSSLAQSFSPYLAGMAGSY